MLLEPLFDLVRAVQDKDAVTVKGRHTQLAPFD